MEKDCRRRERELQKRLICGILCMAMILSLIGCGQAETTTTWSEEMPTEATPTETTQVPVESFLAIAQGFIDTEDFDSAIAVLEQAKAVAEDERIDEMLAQIEEMRSIPLDVVFSVDSSGLKSGTAQIHSVTATERHDGFVRFVIDYTATKGMYFRVGGVRLDYTGNFRTTGMRDIFSFEMPAADLRSMGREILVSITNSNKDMLVMQCVVSWPGDSKSSAVEIPLRQGSIAALSGCEIHSVSVHALDETRLYFNVEYTASRPGMYVTVNAGDEEPFYYGYTDNGRRQFAFIADRTIAEASEVLHLSIRENETSQNGTAVEMHLSDYELPSAVQPSPEPARELSYAVCNTIPGEGYEISSCTAQLLSSGFVHYKIEYNAVEGVSGGAHGFPNGSSKAYPTLGIDGAASGTAEIFVPLEDIQASEEVIVAFTSSVAREYYELRISNSWVNAVTEGNPVGETVELPIEVNVNPDNNRYAFHSCKAQPLDNGYIRFSFAFDSPEQLPWRVWYNTTRHKAFSSSAQAGSQLMEIDIPVEDIRYNGSMSFLLNWLSDKMMDVTIDASSVIGDNVREAPAINLNILCPEPKVKWRDGEDTVEAITVQLAQMAKDLTVTPAIDREAAMAVDTTMIQPLDVSRRLMTPMAQSGIQPYDEFWLDSFPENADLSDNRKLAYSITFSNETYFPEKMPAGFDPQVLLEWGKDPGLNVDVLHELGYTGKGAVIAYVDQPIHDHEAYSNVNLHYTNNTNSHTSMHGPAVLSLLAGAEIGTAPEAEVYFYGHASWEADQNTHAECLYQIIEQNKSLPEGEKITMVGFSDNIDPTEKNTQAFRDAVAACEKAGIMVWFCGEYSAAAFLPLSDKSNFDNVIPDQWGRSAPELVYVPAGSRTTATGENGEYIYWASGGLSWAMPYVLGLYGIVNEIDSSLSQDDLRKMIVETAYVKDAMKIVNPVEFVAAALEGVGRNEDAAELRAAACDNAAYTYAVMNKSKMSKEDIAAAENHLKNISDSQVLVVDSSGITSAQQLYTILQADHIQRGGKVVGVQIFGNADLVPSFEIGYKVQMDNGVDDMGFLLTDLFYGNFNNSASDLSKNYNVMDHFSNGWQVRLVPEWKVARLPLAKGEFAAFFEKYMEFAETAGLGKQTLVNFSNPIFGALNHIDDMGYFLNRLGKEFSIDLGDYRLYGNQLGQYPVTTEVLGGFTAENLTAENQRGTCEFIINGHGQWNNVDKCWFENGMEKRESLMNMSDINAVLAENPYYLDMWTCNNGYAMKNNITTTALNGNCVGMFSTTHVISNNGVKNQVSLEAMTESNFYWFYLNYLKALSEGASRSDAFFEAQKAYGNALMVDSQNAIRGESNYQFNLYNLLGYHNFGVLEPNAAFSCISSTFS